VFQNQKFNHVQIALSAGRFTVEFNVANHTATVATTLVINPPELWSLCSFGVLMLNVDVGCFKDETVGWGMVIRDHIGVVEFVATELERRYIYPNLVEALALHWCLH